MPNYLQCTCGNNNFKILSSTYIMCSKCKKEWDIIILLKENQEEQDKIAKEDHKLRQLFTRTDNA